MMAFDAVVQTLCFFAVTTVGLAVKVAAIAFIIHVCKCLFERWFKK